MEHHAAVASLPSTTDPAGACRRGLSCLRCVTAIKTFPDDEITIIGSDRQSLSITGALNTAGNGFGDVWAYTY
jgi:hypothetical protein